MFDILSELLQYTAPITFHKMKITQVMKQKMVNIVSVQEPVNIRYNLMDLRNLPLDLNGRLNVIMDEQLGFSDYSVVSWNRNK